MPNTTGVGGCDPGNLYNCNTYSQGTRCLANVTSHEYMEAITDADISAWYDSSGSEIGDKCAWQFSSCVPLSTGSWQLQQEWSNSASGCVQQSRRQKEIAAALRAGGRRRRIANVRVRVHG
jgi:hypothetical protein